MLKNLSAGLMAIFALIVVVIVMVALYLGGFALQRDSADRRTDVVRSTEQYRTATEASIRAKASEITRMDVDLAKGKDDAALVSALTGQRVAYIRDACADVAKIQDAGLPGDIASFASQNC